MPRRGIWILIGVLFIPFGVVGAVALAAVAISGSVLQTQQASLTPGTVPAAYATLIEAAGAACPQMSAPLLAAQLYQESAFDPKAVSPAGAEGIAQFLPGTWPNWSSPQDGDGKQDIWNPADAIPAAARYDCALAQQVSKIAGDQINNMLAAYNAGPGAVEAAGGVPAIAETQNYVKNIRILEQAFAAPAGTVATSDVAVRAIAFAYDRLGTPYLWGGTGTAADNGEFDCSGLTQAAYGSVGVTIPRVAADQWYAGPHVPRAQLMPGDLVFFAYNVNDPSTIHHVGIYVGGGAMIDAPHTGASIRFDPIDTFGGYIGAVRPYAQVPTWPIGQPTPSVSASATP
ncbi:MAG TPA: bifunctional lytic transglycosylase/C40 family peptidase [Actinocrinis sp.]|jgi:cell wall-associated NlpC family hydrolase|uniref:C40 family peptidase n=1 Tax=Actinocrinis sp. TaxID=1920516 RepID=UPI002DDD8D49|nr:bifunctional lytic transglycosylase/C40 family peptidase [Actinocrinis sp.]HEV3169374.1 bifunctional lytic transglycosylase/C40 family peptidase [Actinocrinis sp.]